MDSQQYTELFGGVTGVIIIVVLAVWAILTFFLPFMVYSIMRSNNELLKLNKKILAELQGKKSGSENKHIEPEL